MGWFRSFLIGRRQRVKINNSLSVWAKVSSGVPQGTILGSLMFLIYINDIAENLDANCRLFADDCLIYKTYNTPEETKILQNDLYKLGFWSDKWI